LVVRRGKALDENAIFGLLVLESRYRCGHAGTDNPNAKWDEGQATVSIGSQQDCPTLPDELLKVEAALQFGGFSEYDQNLLFRLFLKLVHIFQGAQLSIGKDAAEEVRPLREGVGVLLSLCLG
jgi:hypothetical protein